MEIKIIQEGTRVYVPMDIVSHELGERVFAVNFLADTGADTTTIAPLDAADVGIDFSNLKKSTLPSIGIGGSQTCEYELHDVIFRLTTIDGKQLAVEMDQIDIIKPEEEEIKNKKNRLYRIPSLLGTDFLQLFKFTYNSHAKLELKQ